MKEKNSKTSFPSKQSSVWENIREIDISPSGKHDIRLSDEFPFLFKYWEFTGGFNLTPNYHDYLELTYITEGRGEFLIENRTFEFTAGDLFILSSNEFHSLQTLPSGFFRACSIYFLPSFIYRMGGDLRDSRLLWPFFNRSGEFTSKVPLNSVQKNEIRVFFSRIGEEYARQRKEYELGVKNLVSGLLLSILRAYPVSALSGREQLRRDQEISRTEKVLRYIGEKYSGPIRLRDAAQIACMSQSHFCLMFKRITGHTLLDYTNRLRIDRARDLLLRSGLKVEQIAFEAGFNSPSHFFKIFRRLARQTPQEYATRYRKATPA